MGFAPFGAEVYSFAHDAVGGPLILLAIDGSHAGRLPAPFLIASIGTGFATAPGSGLDFFWRRFARLLPRWVAGGLVLNPATGPILDWIVGDGPAFRSVPPDGWRPIPPGHAMHPRSRRSGMARGGMSRLGDLTWAVKRVGSSSKGRSAG